MPETNSDNEDDGSDDIVRLTAQTEFRWRNFLSDFNEKVWPLFREYGFSKDAALAAWMMAKLNDNIVDLQDLIDDLKPYWDKGTEDA